VELGLWYHYQIFVYCLSLFTIVCHVRSTLDFAADFFGKFRKSSLLLVRLISMLDYNSNEIVIFLVLGKCRDNYRRAPALYQRFPKKKHHPNDSMIRNRASWTT